VLANEESAATLMPADEKKFSLNDKKCLNLLSVVYGQGNMLKLKLICTFNNRGE